jgi:hypothetical protein
MARQVNLAADSGLTLPLRADQRAIDTLRADLAQSRALCEHLMRELLGYRALCYAALDSLHEQQRIIDRQQWKLTQLRLQRRRERA